MSSCLSMHGILLVLVTAAIAGEACPASAGEENLARELVLSLVLTSNDGDALEDERNAMFCSMQNVAAKAVGILRETFSGDWNLAESETSEILSCLKSNALSKQQTRVEAFLAVSGGLRDRFDEALPVLLGLSAAAGSGNGPDGEAPLLALRREALVAMYYLGRDEDIRLEIEKRLSSEPSSSACVRLRYRRFLHDLGRLVARRLGDDDSAMRHIEAQKHVEAEWAQFCGVGFESSFGSAEQSGAFEGLADARIRAWWRLYSTACDMEEMADHFRLAGDLGAALLAQGRALAIHRAASGHMGSNSLLSEYTYAVIEQHMGRLQQSRERMDALLETVEESPFAGTTVEELLVSSALDLVDHVGTLEDTLELAIRLDRVVTKRSGRWHPQRIRGLSAAAWVSYKMKRYQEAVGLAREWLLVSEKYPGYQMRKVASALTVLADSLLAMGRAEEAIVELRKLTEILSTLEMTEDDLREYTVAMTTLAGAFRGMSRHEESEMTARKCVEVLGNVGAPGMVQAGHCALGIATSLVLQGKLHGALSECNAWISRLEEVDPASTAGLLETRAVVQRRMGSNELAEEDAKRAEKLRMEQKN